MVSTVFKPSGPAMVESLNSIEKFDDIFNMTGGMGLFQILICFFSVLMDATGSAIILYFVFDVANPGWYCPALNDTGDINGTGELVEGFCVDGRPCENFTFDSMYTSAVTEWTLICDRTYIRSLIGSIFFVGVLLGSILFSQISDLYGRKMANLLSWSTAIAFHAMAMVHSYWQLYATFRLVAGLAAGGIVSVSPVLQSEYLGPKWRSILGLQFGWQVGPLLMTGLCYAFRDWKWQCLAIGLWSAPFFLIACFLLPESARWLFQKNRFKEGEIWIARMAKINRKPCPDVTVLKQIAVRENFVRKNRQKYSFHDLFSTKKLAIRSLSLLFLWFSVAIITYVIESQLSGLSGNIYLNVSISFIIILGTRWMFILILNFTGLRKGYLITSGIMCCLMIVVVVLDCTVPNATAKTILILAAKILTVGPWSIVLLYSIELYPTLMRNISVGAGNVLSKIGGVLSPQAALLATLHPSAPYALLAVLAGISSILVYVNLPETLGRPLSEDIPTTMKTSNCDIACEHSSQDKESIHLYTSHVSNA